MTGHQSEGVTPFAPGQVWTYKGADLPSSRVVVGCIDHAADKDKGPIISIAVMPVLLPDSKTGALEPKEIYHAPMDEKALRESVLILESSVDVPQSFGEGYAAWREAYDTGEAGWFTVSVAELIRLYRTALTRQEA